ncbi:hypothetical protein WN944_025632 [Citrus x changshan-huyou]|uniref:Uncharacterized protein n=1 Tax=Citrus x changshan-huyou TaxID=2935761 RepID=A0AAP0LR83_9ROSI
MAKLDEMKPPAQLVPLYFTRWDEFILISALVDLPGPEHLLKPERLSIYGSVGILSSKLRKT